VRGAKRAAKALLLKSGAVGFPPWGPLAVPLP